MRRRCTCGRHADLGVGDHGAVEVGRGVHVGVAERRRRAGCRPGPRRLRPLRLQVLGRRDHGDRVDRAVGQQLGGDPQGERGLAGARRGDRQEVVGCAGAGTPPAPCAARPAAAGTTSRDRPSDAPRFVVPCRTKSPPRAGRPRRQAQSNLAGPTRPVRRGARSGRGTAVGADQWRRRAMHPDREDQRGRADHRQRAGQVEPGQDHHDRPRRRAARRPRRSRGAARPGSRRVSRSRARPPPIAVSMPIRQAPDRRARRRRGP